ncbi:hypothetical protein [Tenacibaculum insulae]|uniref:hypothetical protein n=1 Tax=Tenacibaculum insulae TaxID=2029677 RepID=UPI003AB6FB8E
MDNYLIYGIPGFLAVLAYWKSNFFISRRQKYIHSPFQVLQIRIGIAIGVFVIVFSIISKIEL